MAQLVGRAGLQDPDEWDAYAEVKDEEYENPDPRVEPGAAARHDRGDGGQRDAGVFADILRADPPAERGT